MPKIFSKLNWNLFSKLFLALGLVSIIPMITSSAIMYFISRDNLENEVSISNLDTLKQTQMAVDNTFEATERISVQIIRNKAVQNFLNNPVEKSQSGTAVKNTMNVADSFQEGVQYIESISIYSFLNNIMVSSGTQRYSEMDTNFIDNYGNSIKSKGFSILIGPDDTGIFGETSRSVQFVEFIFETFNKPQGIVLIKLKNDEFEKFINEMYIRKTGYILVLNQKGNIILGKNKKTDAFNPTEFLANHRGVPEGYYTFTTGKQKLLVSFTTSRYNQWKYVAVLPADEVQDKTNLIGETILLICMAFALTALMLSFFLSRGIYSPIAAIELFLQGTKKAKRNGNVITYRKDEFGRIQQELDNKVAKLKNYFLYRLVFGDFNNKEEIEKQALFLDIPISENYVVFLVKMDSDYENFDASIDIIQSHLKETPYFLSAFVNSLGGQNSVVVILMFGSDVTIPEIRLIVKGAVTELRTVMTESLEVPVTLAVGEPYAGLEQMRCSYNDAVEALRFNFVAGVNALIFKHELDQGTRTSPHKYFSKNQIINCLNAGNYERVSEILLSFKASMKENIFSKADYIYQCKEILNIIREYLETLGSRFEVEKNQLQEILAAFEKRFDNIDKAVAWMDDFIKQLIDKSTQGDPEDMKRHIVDKAVATIEKEFDRDVSLSYIAEKAGISDPYLSKIFKEELGENFKDYLTNIRLKKAQDLLAGTDMAVSVISRKVGYNNDNQFIKMFKKYQGVTPGEYRKSIRHQEGKGRT